jgi:hypothetical protein
MPATEIPLKLSLRRIIINIIVAVAQVGDCPIGILTERSG